MMGLHNTCCAGLPLLSKVLEMVFESLLHACNIKLKYLTFLLLADSLASTFFKLQQHQISKQTWKFSTVKLGNKERFDKEQIGIKEPFPVTNLPFTS